jgi:hypothetical protein
MVPTTAAAESGVASPATSAHLKHGTGDGLRSRLTVTDRAEPAGSAVQGPTVSDTVRHHRTAHRCPQGKPCQLSSAGLAHAARQPVAGTAAHVRLRAGHVAGLRQTADRTLRHDGRPGRRRGIHLVQLDQAVRRPQAWPHSPLSSSWPGHRGRPAARKARIRTAWRCSSRRPVASHAFRPPWPLGMPTSQ